MSLLEDLKNLGVNIDEGLNRLNKNEKLYTKLLFKFAQSIKKYYIEPDYNCSDYTEISEKAHAIKGTAGNLSITPIYDAYSEIMVLLRSDKNKEAMELIEKTHPVLDEIIKCIENHVE